MFWPCAVILRLCKTIQKENAQQFFFHITDVSEEDARPIFSDQAVQEE